MVSRWWTSGMVLAAVACSGESELSDSSSGKGTGGTIGGSDASGGSDAVGGSSAGSDGSGAVGGSSAGSDGSGASAGGGVGGSAGGYVPDRTDVPPEGDGRVTGSFEGNLGDGWDFCFTNKKGAAAVRDGSEPSASAGSTYMSFDSTLECTSPCAPDGDDAQFGFWLDAEVPADVPVHLYFDAINLTDEAPLGVLQLDALGFVCETTEPLATIELGELALTREWQTRCVTFAPTASFEIFGAYVLGEAFHIGLDAFRFGPPCRAP